MASPFPRWANSWIWVGIAAALGVAAGVPAFLMVWVRTPNVTGQFDPIQQPVEFDHRHHVADDGIDCRYCHDQVDRSPYAGVPPTERCLGCHNQIWKDSPLLAPVWESYFSDRPIRWNRVHRLPDFVYFDHAIHVKKGVGCESCHGRVDRMARVYQVAPLSMGWCLECHRAPGRHLRPPEAITTMGWAPGEPRAALARALVARYDVRAPTNCTACHR